VFILHSDADSARLVRPADGRLLQREVAASGVKYTAKGMLVWSKGDEALIEIDGRRYRGCRNNRAKAAWEQARIDGADFRALGNEPGWILEIDEDTGVTFVTDYGQTRHRFDRPSRHGSPTQGRIQYIAPGHDGEIVIVLTTATCLDDMSGEPFPVKADVRFGDRGYRGCGRMLREIPHHH
jgi:putative lipoprotein